MKRFKQIVKDGDWFGHPVALNFNNHGSAHNTLIGGVCSFVLKLLLTAYLAFKTRSMIMLEDPNISVERSTIEFRDV